MICIYYCILLLYRASLETEKSRRVQFERDQVTAGNAITRLEAEVKGLQESLKLLTSDLEEARSRLAEYQRAEDSLERSAHTISSLHQVMRPLIQYMYTYCT